MRSRDVRYRAQRPGDRRRRRACARANNNGNATGNGFALQVFGRSIRESNCDCDRSMEASLLQTVYPAKRQRRRPGDRARQELLDRTIIQKPAAERSLRSRQRQGADARANESPHRARMKKAKKTPQQIKRIEERIAALEKQGADAARPSPQVADLALEAGKSSARPTCGRSAASPPPTNMIAASPTWPGSNRPLAGAKGLLWTLLNTKEFIVNH